MAYDEQARRASQHHARFPAVPCARAEPGRERLAISAPKLALEHRVRKLRRHRRRRMQSLAKPHRPTRDDHLNWHARMGSCRSVAMTFGISRPRQTDTAWGPK